MSCTSWSISLLVVGVLAELAGVVIAFLEIRDRARELRAYEQQARNVTVYASSVLGVASGLSASVSTVGEQTIEDRVAELERQVRELLPQRIQEVKKEAVDLARHDTTSQVSSLERAVNDRLANLAALLVGSLSGHRRAFLGLGLLVGGLLIQSAGGVVGSLCR